MFRRWTKEQFSKPMLHNQSVIPIHKIKRILHLSSFIQIPSGKIKTETWVVSLRSPGHWEDIIVMQPRWPSSQIITSFCKISFCQNSFSALLQYSASGPSTALKSEICWVFLSNIHQSIMVHPAFSIQSESPSPSSSFRSFLLASVDLGKSRAWSWYTWASG